MQKVYQAVWYDRANVERLARVAGWNGKDSLLDAYHPDENSDKAATCKRFNEFDAAVAHAKSIVADGVDFWGQTAVLEIEIVPRGQRCAYCTCRGERVAREHEVEASGVVGSHGRDDCAD